MEALFLSQKWVELRCLCIEKKCITLTLRETEPLVCQIQERKELLKGSFKDRHYNAGSILLGFGVFESIFGGVNTWFRTGKLFPGPHLFSGAGKSTALQSLQN